MRSGLCSILALSALLAARTIHAQADDLKPAPGNVRCRAASRRAPKSRIESQKQKAHILEFLEATRALARWTPSEAHS
jgi:hypothetical protein